MKIRIEIEIGDKIIANEKLISDEDVTLSQTPAWRFWSIFQSAVLEMQPAVNKAIKELLK